MSDTHVPDDGLIAYFGPELSVPVIAEVEKAGYRLSMVAGDSVEAAFAENVAMVVLGLGSEHPLRSALQTEAARRGIPVLSDLALLSRLHEGIVVPDERRVLITGSAGKTVTAALLMGQLAQGGKDAIAVSAADGYLNALAMRTEVLILHVRPSFVKDALALPMGAAVVLNLTEDHGLPVGQKAREACADLLSGARWGVLGADDPGTQSLLMAVRRRCLAAAHALVPISGGATLSDGWFAIDRAIYAIRNGRTRRVASYRESPVLIGDHFGQDAAAASAVAGFLGVSDDHLAAGLTHFRGVAGRFDCIGADGRVVFVDDRYAVCEASTAAAIAACPDVFWIGRKTGSLTKKVEHALKGRFFVQGSDGSGPPVDDVVTFADVQSAAQAALRAARDHVAADPASTPVVLFSPGAPGLEQQGEFFRLLAVSALSKRRNAHG